MRTNTSEHFSVTLAEEIRLAQGTRAAFELTQLAGLSVMYWQWFSRHLGRETVVQAHFPVFVPGRVEALF